MREHDAAWAQHDVAIAVVTFEADAIAQAYVRDNQLPWPVLVDPNRGLYQAYGMDRASARDIWSPRTWLAYARLMRKGHKRRAATDDVRQRGGDVLIDPAGIVRIHHVGAGPADRPTVNELIAALG